MNMTHYKFNLVLALVLANGFVAVAQSNDAASTDYASFSRVVADRNIFDPNRISHSPGKPRSTYHPPRSHSTSAPAFSLVGTMSYEKGMFAFFSGNNADLKKILVLDGGIAGYTVTEITPTQVTLQTVDKTNLVMKIGEVMRQEGGSWQLTGAGEVAAEPSVTEPTKPGGESAASSGSAESSSAPVVPSAGSSAASEILKRLMQKREQESK